MSNKLLKYVAIAIAVLLADLLFALLFFDVIRETSLFRNTENFVKAAAVLTFLEGILCIVLGAAGYGLGERVGMAGRALTTGRVDVGKYAEDRERSISSALRLFVIGPILLLFTLILSLLPQ